MAQGTGRRAESQDASGMSLDTLPIGKDAVVASVDCAETSLRAHLLDRGHDDAGRASGRSR